MDSRTNELLLKILLEIEKHGFIDNPIPKILERYPDLNEQLVRASLADLKKRGLVTLQFGDNTIVTAGLADVAYGYFREREEMKMKKINQEPSIKMNINVGTNLGAIGTNSNFNIYNNANIEELSRLIQEKTAVGTPERYEVESLRDKLKEIEESKEPIPRGFLSDFSETMQKHSWVTGPTLGFLLQLALKVSG